jgi:beta-N-acetylhexosaminidase
MPAGLAVVCGQLLTVGVAGTTLSDAERAVLGRRGGVVLFKRNVPEDLAELLALTRAIATIDDTLLIGIDQEGGRVMRIGPPALALPAMRRLGDTGDVGLIERVARAQGRELAAMGITMSFSPVADTHTRAENPVIGERAFATTPDAVAKYARAWARGLSHHVLTCAKHFPGHGDTIVDSHHALPTVDRSAAELRKLEIAPFAALVSNVDAMMSAHVVYPALAPTPATLSPSILTDLLRRELRFEGVIFSDDMEMKAIAIPIEEAAVLAVTAGCDALLVCADAELAARAEAGLVREAELSPAFRARCEEAHARYLAMRKRRPIRPGDLASALEASRPIADELARLS